MARRPGHADDTLVLNAGGLRSLLAVSQWRSEHRTGATEAREGPRLTFLFVHDGRDAEARRLEFCRRQAEALSADGLETLHLPHLFATGHEREAEDVPAGGLTSPQLLLAATALALRTGHRRLLWPAAVDADTRASRRALEQVQLIENVATAEDRGGLVRIDTPLLQLADRELAQLARGLRAPLTLAWTCTHAKPTPCGACRGCHRRINAGL